MFLFRNICRLIFAHDPRNPWFGRALTRSKLLC